ncbi:hypothetical protein, partial [Mycobacterium avium]|uniref:hypothetical protein n=1 Tax=Mycobacterium avium TaxID=1764 RepID=UPI00373FE046
MPLQSVEACDAVAPVQLVGGQRLAPGAAAVAGCPRDAPEPLDRQVPEGAPLPVHGRLTWVAHRAAGDRDQHRRQQGG